MGKIVARFWDCGKTKSELIMKCDLAKTERHWERSNYVFWICMLVIQSEEPKMRMIILVVPSVISFSSLDGNQYFIQTSKIVNFTKAIENQCFIFHNMCFSIQNQLTHLEHCVLKYSQGWENTTNMENKLFIWKTKFTQQKNNTTCPAFLVLDLFYIMLLKEGKIKKLK